ncbi:MAG: hypothetical protein ACRC2K_02580, partial [Clostridium sp.]
MLYRNAIKLLKKKKFQLIGIGVIIFLSSLVYTSMYNSMTNLEKATLEFFEKGNQEDFSISMSGNLTKDEALKYNLNPFLTLDNVSDEVFNEIIEGRINSFNKAYEGYDLELRKSKDVLFNEEGEGKTIRVLKGNDRINVS